MLERGREETELYHVGDLINFAVKILSTLDQLKEAQKFSCNQNGPQL